MAKHNYEFKKKVVEDYLNGRRDRNTLCVTYMDIFTRRISSFKIIRISFTVEPYDPRDKYPDVKDCGYPYRAIKEDW